MSSTSSARTDRADSQLEAGLHISQGLWETAGLQLSYSYRALLGNNSFSDRQLASWRFAYLGEDFLFSGHRLYAAFTQMLPFDMKAVVGAEFLARSYGGWKAVDSAGAELASDRYDYRLTPSVSLDYVWGSDSESEYAYLIPFVTASVKYSYVRQWSNSFAFDTDAHIAEVLVGLEW